MTNSLLRPEYTSSWALVIGINKYQHLTNLTGAVKDAAAVAEVLRDDFRFPASQVQVLLDGDATQSAIKEQLEILSQRTEADDRVVIYFAGHGETRRIPNGTNIGYIACVETMSNAWHTFLRIDDVTNYSQLLGAKHVLFVFDACFSGLALVRGIGGTTSPDVKRWLKDCLTHRACQVITAGLAEQPVSDLSSDGHSIFTSHLLKALKGDAAGSEGEITASRVMAYVSDRVMKSAQSRQTPAFGDILGSEPGGDMVFQHPNLHYFKVPANKEGGINTSLRLQANEKISIVATGVISYDAYGHYTNADGLLCTYKGQPMTAVEHALPMIFLHDEAYRTNGGQQGRIGSLFGWVGEYSETSAFLIGENAEIVVPQDGFLHLAVNDQRAAYDDNKGEYDVTVRILR